MQPLLSSSVSQRERERERERESWEGINCTMRRVWCNYRSQNSHMQCFLTKLQTISPISTFPSVNCCHQLSETPSLKRVGTSERGRGLNQVAPRSTLTHCHWKPGVRALTPLASIPVLIYVSDTWILWLVARVSSIVYLKIYNIIIGSKDVLEMYLRLRS